MFKKKSNISRYTDPTNEFDNKQLHRAYWFARNRLTLRKIFVYVLGAWCVLSISISGFFWIKYAAYDYWLDEALLARKTTDFTNYAQVQEQYSAIPIQYSQTSLFTSAKNKYTFSTNVQNTNERFVASIRFHYTYAGGRTATADVVVLPQMQIPLTIVGHEYTAGRPAQPRLVIESVSWKRISYRTVKDMARFKEEHLNLETKDVEYISLSQNTGALSPQLSFTIINNSVYDYWDFPIYIELYQQNSLKGILYTTIQNFKGNEERAVNISTANTESFIDSIEVIPAVNIFDSNVFIDPT